jgi:hypothetical protein
MACQERKKTALELASVLAKLKLGLTLNLTVRSPEPGKRGPREELVRLSSRVGIL